MICRWTVLQGRARLPGRAHRQNSWLTGANGLQIRANLLKTDVKAPKAMRVSKSLIENAPKVFGMALSVDGW